MDLTKKGDTNAVTMVYEATTDDVNNIMLNRTKVFSDGGWYGFSIQMLAENKYLITVYSESEWERQKPYQNKEFLTTDYRHDFHTPYGNVVLAKKVADEIFCQMEAAYITDAIKCFIDSEEGKALMSELGIPHVNNPADIRAILAQYQSEYQYSDKLISECIRKVFA